MYSSSGSLRNENTEVHSKRRSCSAALSILNHSCICFSLFVMILWQQSLGNSAVLYSNSTLGSQLCKLQKRRGLDMSLEIEQHKWQALHATWPQRPVTATCLLQPNAFRSSWLCKHLSSTWFCRYSKRLVAPHLAAHFHISNVPLANTSTLHYGKNRLLSWNTCVKQVPVSINVTCIPNIQLRPILSSLKI